MRILIADDDDASRYLLTCILKSEPSYVVHAAKDGEDAWAVLQQQSAFDLAILDVMMPGLTGIELLSRIRSDRRFARLPVILCTALNDRTTVSSALALEINHYIVKPYARKFVLEKVSAVATEQVKSDVLESAEIVCGRLGLEEEMWRTMLQRLGDNVAAWVTDLQQVLRVQQLRALALRANAMSGSCLNLGATGLAGQLAAAEATLGAMEPEGMTTSGGMICDPIALSEIATVADNVRREENRFRQALTEATPKAT
jgi:CheY-like chemotaxis protein